MIFSKPTGYAIRALVFLGENRDDAPILNSIISKHENIPQAFLSRVFASLVEAGIVKSTRGRNGGYTLIKEPEDIRLIDITNINERRELFGSCLLGFGSCICYVKCEFHSRWVQVQSQIDEYLETTSIGDVISDRKIMHRNKMVRP
ncbi:HTH-type transcriptional regulator CymR [bacterium BMS3Bbin04]|nr:HTH-type transcriptional regulator CymR [bacterium BMS3Bbin04]